MTSKLLLFIIMLIIGLLLWLRKKSMRIVRQIKNVIFVEHYYKFARVPISLYG